MKLFEVVDEFQNAQPTNKTENVKHLYRVQKAKCHAIDLFIHQLAKQFPDWWKDVGYNYWEDHPTKEWEFTPSEQFGNSIIPYRLPSLVHKGDHQKIREMFRRKYEDVKRAKQAFEDAGGDYPNADRPPDLEIDV